MTNEYKSEVSYFAFISYKREDWKWAKWVKKHIQGYRLPFKVARRYRDLPRKLNPVFLDKMDLKPGCLEEELKKEVAASKYLIVICSRLAHENSEYLDKEIRFFLESGHSVDEIIPFIVDKSEKPEINCFPRALIEICHSSNLLGVNVFENGKKRALLKAIAYMHGIRLFELENEEKKREKRKRFERACLIISVFLIIAIYNRFSPKTSYYLDYAKKYGIPEGIHELSLESLNDVPDYYAITVSNGKVRKLEHIVEYETFQSVDVSKFYDYLDKGCTERYIYNGENLDETKYYDETGAEIYTAHDEFDYDRNTGIIKNTYSNLDYVSDDFDLSKIHISDLPTYLLQQMPTIPCYLVRFDEEGYEEEIRFSSYSSYYWCISNTDGVYGYKYERDKSHRIHKVSYISPETDDPENSEASKIKYHLTSDSSGISSFCYEYDNNGHIDKITYCSENDKAILCEDSYSCVKIDYSDVGNEVKKTYYGLNNELALTKDGYACVERIYVENGSFVEASNNRALLGYRFYGKNGELILTKDGYASVDFKYDAAGNLAFIKFGDCAGNLIDTSYGYSYVEIEYTGAELIERCTFFSSSGEIIKMYKREDGDFANYLAEEY